MRLQTILSTSLAAAVLLPINATADGFYGGIEAAHERLRFEPHYYEPDGTPDGSFVNRASGQAGALFVGHRRIVSPDFSLAVEARFAISDTRWRLRLPSEPASLRYDIPYSASLTLQPAYHLSDRLAMFAEAGVAWGRIHERKWSSPDSTYDERRWRPGLVLGVGVSLRLGDAWSARLGYRETRYRELRYNARDAGGDVVERIRDKPRQATWHLGLVRDF